MSIFPKFHKDWAKNCGLFTWALRFQNRLSNKITTLKTVDPLKTMQLSDLSSDSDYQYRHFGIYKS